MICDLCDYREALSLLGKDFLGNAVEGGTHTS